MVTRSSFGLRRWLLACGIALLAAAALRVMYVHDKTWEYTLVPSSTPPKVGYDQRDYRRGKDVARVESGFVSSGKTMGGGRIYAPSGNRTATVIDVTSGKRVVAYSLIGGP